MKTTFLMSHGFGSDILWGMEEVLVKKQKTARQEKLERTIRSALSAYAKSVLKPRGSIKEFADKLELSKSSIEKMSLHGQGSVVSWLQFFKEAEGIEDSQFKAIIDNFPKALSQADNTHKMILDKLFDDLKNEYTANELAAWMKLLLSKSKIEKKFGVKVKADLASN